MLGFFSNNQTIKVSGQILMHAFNSTSDGYAVPANSFAVVTIIGDGVRAYSISDGVKTLSASTTATNVPVTSVYVGAGQTISLSAPGAGANIYAVGAVFLNSP